MYALAVQNIPEGKRLQRFIARESSGRRSDNEDKVTIKRYFVTFDANDRSTIFRTVEDDRYYSIDFLGPRKTSAGARYESNQIYFWR